jgi:hypothetical protein
MDKLTLRNNTSFLRALQETIKSLQIDKTDKLKYHQRIVHEYLLRYPHVRGILADHGMGSGKTRLAVSIFYSVAKANLLRKTLFISSKTLHGNFRGEYKKYLTALDEYNENSENFLNKNCNFITLTANNMLRQVISAVEGKADDLFTDEEFDIKRMKKELQKISASTNLDNMLLIIDEAHNFFNGITNGSKNYIGLYQLIMNAKNIKILFLTGSPITNDPFEVALCFNMLSGYYTYKVRGKPDEQLTLFGEDYDDFRKYFVEHPDKLDVDSDVRENNKVVIPKINNKDKFTNRVVGLVSFYGTDQEDIKALVPEMREVIIERIPMSTLQYASYAAARDREQDESKRGIFKGAVRPLQKPQGASSSYRVRSRQISNFLYPKHASIITRDDKGFEHIEKIPEKIQPADLEIAGLEIYSPKLRKLMINLSVHLPFLPAYAKLAKAEPPAILSDPIAKNPAVLHGPGVIYSQFIDSGIGLIAKTLTLNGFTEITSVGQNTGKAARFAIISGEVDPEFRAEIVKMMLDPNNKKGEYLALLLITATGAEGIDTKYVKHVHAFEPFWHWARLAQVFARGRRLGSHMDLPKEEQFVQPYIYLSDYPSSFQNVELAMKAVEDTTDVTLYYKAVQNQILIDSFLKCLQEASIDCNIHYHNDPNVNCKMCSPTDTRLYMENLAVDIITPSTCQTLQEEKIKAHEITISDAAGDRVYMYYIDNKKVIHILSLDSNLGGYVEIFEDHPDYDLLLAKIEKSKNKK